MSGYFRREHWNIHTEHECFSPRCASPTSLWQTGSAESPAAQRTTCWEDPLCPSCTLSTRTKLNMLYRRQQDKEQTHENAHSVTASYFTLELWDLLHKLHLFGLRHLVENTAADLQSALLLVFILHKHTHRTWSEGLTSLENISRV